MTTSPYAFVKRGNLFIVPVGPTIAEPPPELQSFAKPPDYSLWVNGKIQEPGLQLDRARMTPRLFQEVRDDLTRYSPVEVTRSAFQRSSHAYVGVIDSKGTPYYFALDSRGVSVREAELGETAWKAFDRLAADELKAAVRQRRAEAAGEMLRVDRELSEPLVVTKGLRYGKKADWKYDAPGSSWWRNAKVKRPRKPGDDHVDDAESTEKAVVARPAARAAEPKGRRDRPGSLQGAGTAAKRHYTRERIAHEGAGGVAIGHTRIRAGRGDEARPGAEAPHHYAHRPEHAIGGPGHRVAGEPEHEKPRGTTSLHRPGDDARRAAAFHRDRAATAPRPKTQAEWNEHDHQRIARHRASDERSRARHAAAAPAHAAAPSQADKPKKRSWLHRLLGKGDVSLVVLPRCQVVQRSSSEASERAALLYVSEYRRVGHELWLQAGDGESELDPPRPDDVVSKAVVVGGRAKNRKRSEFDQEQLKIGTKHEMEHTNDEDVARRIAMDHLVEEPRYYEKLKCVEKALPKKNKESKTKKTPSRKASSKKLGAGGKTRYAYPQEGSGGPKQKQTPLIVVHDDTKHADPAELANQLGVSVRTLQRAARRLGSDGFATFMRSRLKRFAMKHRLDPDYWSTLYATLSTASKDEN